MAKQLTIGSHHVTVFTDTQSLIHALAKKLRTLATQNAEQNRHFVLSLSGGTTPKQLYSYLASDASFTPELWQQFEIYFGDERYVPHTNAQSNYRMAKETWLDRVPIPVQQIYPVPTHCENIDECAALYAQTMYHLPMVNDIPYFDVILLGMGDDGHTASLFPETPVLQEQEKLVAGVYVPKFDSQRITFTYPLINNAKQIIVQVTGENKAAMLKRVFYEPEANLPIQQLQNQNAILWYVDAAAAAELG